jgi:hypothetical protein
MENFEESECNNRTRKLNFLNKLNISEKICDHLIGQNHTVIHRITVGFLICCAGVGITEIPHFEIALLHKFYDIVGYIVHGIGGIPIIKYFFKE